jgi:hypothetical protein
MRTKVSPSLLPTRPLAPPPISGANLVGGNPHVTSLPSIARGLVILVAITCLSACDRNTSRIEEAKKAVKEHLTDPDSAKFDAEVAGADPKIVCGFVNSKNKMGGYDGRALFLFKRGTGAAILSHPPTADDLRNLIKFRTMPGYDKQWKDDNRDCYILNLAVQNCPRILPETSHQKKLCAAWDNEKGDPEKTLAVYEASTPE